ncbi:MAG: DUF1971 domain-containing protein [Gammaproteobacteria bacterium PRO9]|nr:DUF1971 domain-containing protein [Gammaproteobacteria bacterium PRO9]
MVPMEAIPDTVVRYQSTKVWDEESVSEAFLAPHCTKRGVWAKIIVLEGTIRYFNDDTKQITELHPERPGIVPPRERHFIRPVGKVRFFIEFYR